MRMDGLAVQFIYLFLKIQKLKMKGQLNLVPMVMTIQLLTMIFLKKLLNLKKAKDLLEQLQNKAADPTNAKNAMPNNDTGGTSEGNTNPSLSEEDLKSLVERTLTERDKDSVVKQNLNLVNNEMEKSYGTDASTKIQNKAKELGLTLERMQEIAAESPTAFFNLIGEPKKDFRPMVEGSVRTEGVNMQASNERDWSYYQNLRRDNRSLYYSPKIQRQLMEDKSRLGGKFGI